MADTLTAPSATMADTAVTDKGPSKGYFLNLLNYAHQPELPEDPVLRADIEQVLKHGYVVLENIIPKEDIEKAKEEVDRLTGDNPRFGRHMFEGDKTVRIYSMLNKTRSFDKFCLLDRVLALNDYFLLKGYNLASVSSIQINPGQTPQLFHHDDGFTYLPRPRAPMGTAILIALDEFTADNGATRVVPDSHLWDSERRPTWEETKPAAMAPGSVVYFLGTTWHCGGANNTDKPRRAATVQYCQSFIRPVENQFLAVDPRRLPEIPERIVGMMGYQLQAPFIGGVDGRHPLKAAQRMVDWLQKPLEKYPPAFATMG